MGVTKSENFSARQNEMAKLARALGHPARIAIVELLLRKNECICGDLIGELQLAQATVSQHLKELRGAGIIRGSVGGTSVCYCLDERILGQLHSFLGKGLERLKEKNNNCC